jgi:hypothetical protein
MVMSERRGDKLRVFSNDGRDARVWVGDMVFIGISCASGTP